jgi:hypothetical protein
MEITLNVDNIDKQMTVERKGGGYLIKIEGREYPVRDVSLLDGILVFFINNRPYRAFVSRNECGTHISLDGRYHLRGGCQRGATWRRHDHGSYAGQHCVG